MKYLLTIVLLFSSGQAMAEITFLNGNDLLEICEAYLDEDFTKGNTCAGFVVGVSDAHQTFVNWGLMKSAWCLPDGVNTIQLVRIATKYLQENPKDLHVVAGSLVGAALGLAFPCE